MQLHVLIALFPMLLTNVLSAPVSGVGPKLVPWYKQPLTISTGEANEKRNPEAKNFLITYDATGTPVVSEFHKRAEAEADKASGLTVTFKDADTSVSAEKRTDAEADKAYGLSVSFKDADTSGAAEKRAEAEADKAYGLSITYGDKPQETEASIK